MLQYLILHSAHFSLIRLYVFCFKHIFYQNICFSFNHFFTVVAQAYKVDVEVLGASRGCSAILRCVIPTFVKELVRVVSWVQEPAFYIYPSLQGGKQFFVCSFCFRVRQRYRCRHRRHCRRRRRLLLYSRHYLQSAASCPLHRNGMTRVEINTRVILIVYIY